MAGKKIRKNQEMVYASNIFTDRELPREAFWLNYDKVKKEIGSDDVEAHVLTYYGVGGIGKSSLLEQLEKELNEKVQKPHYVTYDFNDAVEMKIVLQSLRNSLVNKYKFSFPLFDFALYHYSQKCGIQMEAPEVKSLISNSELLDTTFSVLGMIPAVATAAQVLQCADKGVALVANFFSEHLKESKEIAVLEKAELYQSLPMFFAKDMNRNMEKIKVPFVIMLDTYEQLVNEMSAIGETLNNDLWLRGEDGLILNIPKVLWVIAGREKIKWDDFLHEGWGDSLEQHILGDLSKTDAIGFLEKAGVAEESLRMELFTLTSGTPVYLDICVKRYHELIAMGKEPLISDFGNNIHVLVERFVRYMDDNRKDMVYMLACIGTWTDEMVLEMIPSIYPSFSIALYEKVKGFSFISSSDSEQYHFHDSVARVLVEEAPLSLKKAVFEEVARFSIEKCQMISSISDVYALYLTLLDRVCSFYQQLYGAEDEKTLSIMEQIVNAMEKTGEYQHALDVVTIVYNVRHKILGSFHLDTVRVLNLAGVLYKKLGDYNQAFQCCHRAYQTYLDVSGENNSATLEARINMADTLRLNGNHQNAIQIYLEAYDKYVELFGAYHQKVIEMVSHMAISFWEMEQYQEAVDLYIETYYRYEKVFGSKDEKTLKACDDMARGLLHLERTEEALFYFEQIYEIYKNKIGALHPRTITAMYNRAICIGAQGDIRTCYDLLMEVFEDRNIVLGTYHPDTKTVAEMLAKVENML